MAEVCLRDWIQSDADRVALIVGDPQVARWSKLPELGPRQWIADQQSGRRGPSKAICTLDDSRALGKVALRLPGRASPATSCDAIGPEDQPAGELSFWLLPDARGRGVATAAVLAALELARSLGTMRTVVLDIEIDNAPSLRVAERVGAERRQPTRAQTDRQGLPRTLAVHVVPL
jgi:[ribosomal protein S5]-alanine N-acetyltransferase